MNESPPSQPSIHSIEEILELYDEAFVRSAYKTILGRVADPGGLANYLSQVRAGVDKVHILVELARSPEGMKRAPNVRGLQQLVAEYDEGTSSILMRIFRQLIKASTEPVERQLRIVDTRLYLVEQVFAKQANQLVVLMSLLHEGKPLADSLNRGLRASDLGDVSRAATQSQFSPNVARTYSELKATISKKLAE
jgi:hypothetical protein